MLFRIVNNPRFFRPYAAGSAYFTKSYKQSRQFRATFKHKHLLPGSASTRETGAQRRRFPSFPCIAVTYARPETALGFRDGVSERPQSVTQSEAVLRAVCHVSVTSPASSLSLLALVRAPGLRVCPSLYKGWSLGRQRAEYTGAHSPLNV